MVSSASNVQPERSPFAKLALQPLSINSVIVTGVENTTPSSEKF